MKLLPKLFLVTLLVIASKTSMMGQIITQSQNFDLADPANTELSFDTFDSSLGNLLSVQLTLSNVFVTGDATVTNETGILGGTAQTTNYTISLVGNYTLVDSISNELDLTLNTPFAQGVLSPGQTLDSGTTTNTTPGFVTQTFNSNLGSYEGDGFTSISLHLTSSNTANASGAAPFLTNQTSSGTGTVTVVYQYSPAATPEPSPATMLALGLGLLGLVHLLRRKPSVR